MSQPGSRACVAVVTSLAFMTLALCACQPSDAQPGFASQSVGSIERLTSAEVRINGGYFVFRREIFDFIEPGEELVEEPFARLIQRRELLAYTYDGFWEPMDTIKDKQKLDALVERGRAPWRREHASPT